MSEQKTQTADLYSSGVLSHDIPTELERLQALQRQLDPVTLAVLSDRELPATARCLELGAGAGSVARRLAERFPAGQVTAVDVDARYLDPGWAPNLKVIEEDLRLLDLPPGSFDLIHARTLFMHLPDREDLVARAARWLAPGGWLVLEDIATFPAETSPNPLWRKTMAAVVELLESQGSDLDWARRRQPAVLAEAGLADLGLSVRVFTLGDGGATDRFWHAFLHQLRPALIDRGLLTAEDLDALSLLIAEPCFLDVGEALISAWGRRPTA